MAVFDKSLKIPMGTLAPGGRATSSFASVSNQRALSLSSTRAGPGHYQPQRDDFTRFEGSPAFQSQRHPLRAMPMSPQLTKSTIRYPTTTPQFEPTVMRDAYNFPGPGRYNVDRYSEFSLESMAARCQPFKVMATTRSSIQDTYPDSRCGIPCRRTHTPSPMHYAPMTPLDRLRLSMPNPPYPGRIRVTRGVTLEAALRSPANLTSTLRDIQPRTIRVMTAA